MLKIIKRAGLCAALAASALLASSPTMARDRYRGHDGGGDDAAIAIGAGIVGLAIGAAIASDGRRGERYYDGGAYYDGPVYRAYPRQYYYYNDGYYDGSRRYRHREYRGHHRDYYRGDHDHRRHWGRGW